MESIYAYWEEKAQEEGQGRTALDLMAEFAESSKDDMLVADLQDVIFCLKHVLNVFADYEYDSRIPYMLRHDFSGVISDMVQQVIAALELQEE